MIREWHGLVDDGRLASILVAFNTTKSWNPSSCGDGQRL